MYASFLACLMGICGASAPVSSGVSDALSSASAVSARVPTPAASTSLSTAAVIAPPQPASGRPFSPVSSASASTRKMSRADIAQVVARKVAAVRRCYEAGLLEDPSLTGVIEIGWKIQVDGHVSSVNIVDAPKRNSAVEGCLLAEIGRWDFPPSPEPVVVGAFPFRLDARLLTRR